VAGSGRVSADERLAAALAAGRPVPKAAKAAAVSERTAWRRLADPAFRRRVAELRGRMVERAVGRLADAMADAAARLRKILRESRDERVQVAACRAVLEFGGRLHEQHELLMRIEDLERQWAGDRANGGADAEVEPARGDGSGPQAGADTPPR
jgi:hypothetical protein